jgi:hypothetical protein
MGWKLLKTKERVTNRYKNTIVKRGSAGKFRGKSPDEGFVLGCGQGHD